MATLILDFHCMCLFVPDPETGSVHVVMPPMHGGHPHEHETGAPDPDKHVVRMLHPSFGQRKGRPMEGWALILDDGSGPAALDLSIPSEPEIPDLSELSGRSVAPSLVYGLKPQGVVSRVTLRAGRLDDTDSEGFEWTLGGIENRVLANRVTWRIPNVPDQLTWVRIGAAGPPPIVSLRELTPVEADTYRIAIHHETESTLPHEDGTGLDPAVARRHFAAFYAALGMTPPQEGTPEGDKLLPRLEGGGSASVMCRSAQASLSD